MADIVFVVTYFLNSASVGGVVIISARVTYMLDAKSTHPTRGHMSHDNCAEASKHGPGSSTIASIVLTLDAIGTGVASETEPISSDELRRLRSGQQSSRPLAREHCNEQETRAHNKAVSCGVQLVPTHLHTRQQFSLILRTPPW